MRSSTTRPILCLILSFAIVALTATALCADTAPPPQVGNLVKQNLTTEPWQSFFYGVFNNLYTQGLSAHRDQQNLYTQRFLEGEQHLLFRFRTDIQRRTRFGETVTDKQREDMKRQLLIDLLPNLKQTLLDDFEIARQRAYLDRYVTTCHSYAMRRLSECHYIAVQGYSAEQMKSLVPAICHSDVALGGIIRYRKFDYDKPMIEHCRAGGQASYASAYLNTFTDLYKREVLPVLGDPFYQHTMVKNEDEYATKLKRAQTLIECAVQGDTFIIDATRTPMLLRLVYATNVLSTFPRDRKFIVRVQPESSRVTNVLYTNLDLPNRVAAPEMNATGDMATQLAQVVNAEITVEALQPIYLSVCSEAYTYGLALHKTDVALYNRRFLESVRIVLTAIGMNYHAMTRQKPDTTFTVKDFEDIHRQFVKGFKADLDRTKLQDDVEVGRQRSLIDKYFSESYAYLLHTLARSRYIALQGYTSEQLAHILDAMSGCRKLVQQDYQEEQRNRTATSTRYNLPLGGADPAFSDDRDMTDMVIARHNRDGALADYLYVQFSLFVDFNHQEIDNLLGSLLYQPIPFKNDVMFQERLKSCHTLIDLAVQEYEKGNVFVVDLTATNVYISLAFKQSFIQEGAMTGWSVNYTDDRVWQENAAYVGTDAESQKWVASDAAAIPDVTKAR